MSFLRPTSIRSKLVGIVVLTTALALVVSGLAFVWYDSIAFERQRLADLETEAQLLGAILTAPLTFDDARAATEYLSALRARATVVEAVVYDAAGGIFAAWWRDPDGSRRAVPDAGVSGPPAPRSDERRVEGNDIIVFKRIAADGEILGTLYLRASLDRSERVLGYAGIVLGVSAASLLVALLMLAKLQAVVSEPILAVTGVARAVIERDDYSQRVEKRSEDEVGVLVEAFNRMLTGIEQREASLQAANEALKEEVRQHAAARDEVAALAADLERRVVERTAELESANRELEAFSYSVSHDLRAPLRSIDGFTHILQETYSNVIDETGRRHMQRVRAATQRMGQLIDDLLKLSRTVRAEMNRVDVDVSELARTVAREIEAAAPGRSVALRIQPGMRANADPRLLRVVFENLLGNAFKFTSRTPEAVIEVGSRIVDGVQAFFVRDNGAGFDMKYADKLFGAFQRLHSVDEYEGTGVGLANVQRIVRRHGGRIWAEAAVGEGATFTFTLS